MNEINKTIKLSRDEIRSLTMTETSDTKETIIAEGTVMKGSITSDCPVTVSGKVDGDLSAPSLNITNSGSVHGQVLVEKLVSNGEISGEIEAQEVNLAGTVKDKTSIKAKTLEVRLDAKDPERLNVTFGDCSLEVGDSSSSDDVDEAEEEEFA